jgi:LPXTG-site transpeptidase (sortase) family protein
MKNIFSIFFILAGLALLIFGIYLVWERNSPQRISFESPPLPQEGSIVEGKIAAFGRPMLIKIPSIDKELQIIPSKIVNDQWESTKKGVSHLDTSPIPGEIGNSIIYGHNYSNILKDLTKVKVGDEISIVFENGGERKFEVIFTQEVRPDQSTILNPTGDRRVTIYTCSGFLDSKRFVVTTILK